jgi:hypothetical protein
MIMADPTGRLPTPQYFSGIHDALRPPMRDMRARLPFQPQLRPEFQAIADQNQARVGIKPDNRMRIMPVRSQPIQPIMSDPMPPPRNSGFLSPDMIERLENARPPIRLSLRLCKIGAVLLVLLSQSESLFRVCLTWAEEAALTPVECIQTTGPHIQCHGLYHPL